MRFFIDTEFVENGITIDLISIGIVADDGREYYACNDECDLSKADNWVKENVLIQLPSKHHGINPGNPNVSPSIKQDILTWKTRDIIAKEIVEFCNLEKYGKPKFYSYYGSYDWVAVCQLFGKMIDLPKGFPMYTIDIKQTLDELGNPRLPEQKEGKHSAIADARWIRDSWYWLKENYSHPAFGLSG